MTPATQIRRALALVLAGGGTLVACSLGLDPALMSQHSLGTAPPSLTTDAASGDDAPASDETGDDAAGGPGCSSDADCQASSPGGACVTSAHCDLAWHLCMYDVCDVGVCATSGCNLLSQQCAAPTPFAYEISLFSVGYGGVGGWGPRYALAAAFPFLFVLTNNGVVAYDVVNPLGSAPPAIPVQGVPFIPVAVVASGRRVYFVGPVAGAGPNYRQAVAWIDVPGNPFLTTLVATTAWIGTTQNALANVLADGTGGVNLEYGSVSRPTAWIHPPLGDTTMIVPAPINGLLPDADLVASSGQELLAYRYNAANHRPGFALVTGVENSSGQASAEQAVTSYGPVDNQAAFGPADDVSALWESAPLRLTADGGTGGVQFARLTWLSTVVDGGAEASLIGAQTFANLENYPASTTGAVVGPPVYLGNDTSLAIAAASGNLEDTSVQVFSRATGALVAGERAIIPVGPAFVGVAASNGFGYLLAQDDPQNRSATIYIVAPGCGSPPVVDGGPADAGAVDGSAADGGAVDGGREGGGGGKAPGFTTLGGAM
jgi:hypothetical protein